MCENVVHQVVALSDKEYCTDFTKHVSEKHPDLHEEIEANGSELPPNDFYDADIARITTYVLEKLEAVSGDLCEENNIYIGNMPETVEYIFRIVAAGRSDIAFTCLENMIASLKEKHRAIYRQPWDASKSDATVHNFCIDIIAYASDPAGLALHKVRQEIYRCKGSKLLYHIPTFYEFIFPALPELKHNEEGADSRALEADVWQRPRNIIRAAICRLKRKYNNAQMIIVNDISTIKDSILKNDVLATINWIGQRTDSLSK